MKPKQSKPTTEHRADSFPVSTTLLRLVSSSAKFYFATDDAARPRSSLWQGSNLKHMLAISAMPAKMKRNVLTQEVVRMRRNISLDLPWETTVKHLNDFSARMRASGYGERYRLEVIKSGVEGFDKMVAEEKNGGRPINQRRTWNEDQRQKKKELQKKNWFKRGGFDVPIFAS